jgi:structural maintenance of chromosome 1
MDAISFVLGIKSAQLRSSQLKDLVYRGRRLARGDGPLPEEEQEEETHEGEGTAQKAWVLAVYEDEAKKEWKFQRTCATLEYAALFVADYTLAGSLRQEAASTA